VPAGAENGLQICAGKLGLPLSPAAARAHDRFLAQDAIPNKSWPANSNAPVERRERLGGLNFYYRRAA
jgi:hypothetical protein